ncbi:uncharacterized protein LOC105189213 [Harpegnathos saltator]|uniref:uncharacterized protein LOC105189213 n=1 Tax=Harpegnathos saltator TaxID=610380 RepID=UPI000948C1F0|nr:uncharacterized protein LOC105189213 [Harpegnathos saltator]
MDFFDNEYYGLTRHLMTLIGLWPYQTPMCRVVRLCCMTVVLVSSILFQCMVFVTNEYTVPLFIEVFSFNILCIIYALKYNTVYFKANHVKQLFNQIQHHWNLIENVDELKILQKYASKIRFFTIFSGSIVYPGTLAFFLTMFVPIVLDIVAPMDEPRPRQFPIQLELFIDQQKHFYLLCIIIMISGLLGMTVLMATENMFMIFMQHACGLFEIVSYRITCAFDKYSPKTTPSKNEWRVCVKLLNACNIHQQCLEFVENVQSKFAASYLVLCILGVASLSVNMFRLFLAFAMHNVSEIITSGLFVYAHFCYVFWMNYFGQDLIDHSECLFQQICNTQWCTAPLYVQKLLFIVLQRSMKTSKVIIGSLFVASLEGFASLTSMSLSYCMFIYSTSN